MSKKVSKVVVHPYIPAMIILLEHWLAERATEGWQLIMCKVLSLHFKAANLIQQSSLHIPVLTPARAYLLTIGCLRHVMPAKILSSIKEVCQYMRWINKK